MTTIIMMEDNHGVQIGYDSQITYGNRKELYIEQKVFRNGEVIFGIAGSALFINQIKFLELPQIETDSLRWVVTKLVPSLRELRKDIDNEDASLNALIIIKGEIFQLDDDLNVSRPASKITVIGSGSDFALGAIAAGAGIKEALTIASSLDCYTGGPLYITSSTRLLGEK